MENRSSGNKPSMQPLETNHENVKPVMKVKTSGLSPYSPSLSSPSSSESSMELSNRRKDSLEDVDALLSASSSSPDHVPNQTPQWSMISASPRGEDPPQFPDFPPQTPEWNGTNPAPMKSPPMHNNMGHPPGYDPNRIPASIFSSKPNNGMEWSTEVKSNEKKNLPPSLPPVAEMATDKEVKSETELESPPLQGKIVEAPKVVPLENHENNIKEKKKPNVDEVASAINKSDEIPHSASFPNKSDGKVVPQFETTSSPRLSNESGNSSSSFAFPVLLNDAGKTGSLKAPSAKMGRPQPQPKPQPDSQPEIQPQSPPYSKPESEQPESQPKLEATTWFSCYSCWPQCC